MVCCVFFVFPNGEAADAAAADTADAADAPDAEADADTADVEVSGSGKKSRKPILYCFSVNEW